MAADPCARSASLIRSGLTQPGRHLAELSRDHFRPDDRDLADLVLFGQRFARQLRFYDQTNTQAGTWETFFASDVTAALAALSKLPMGTLARFQTDVEGWLRAVPARGGAADLGAQFRVWLHLGPATLQAAGRSLDRLPGDHALALAAPRLVARDLAQPLADLAGWIKGALDVALFADTPLTADDLNLTGAAADTRPRASGPVADVLLNRTDFASLSLGARLSEGLSAGQSGGGWAAVFAAAAADGTPYADAGTAPGRIHDALGYSLLTRAVARLREGCLRLQSDAAAALQASLTGFADHAPHYGLWLAFLDLFRHAQADMNAFTGRHLDFYLRDVLRLTPLAAQPDHAHLTFDLARGTGAHLIPAGTAFGAGKDGLGRPVTFALDSDLVANGARVARLAAIRRRSELVDGQWETRIEAASDIRSADGLGEVPLPAGAAFAAFGPDPSPAARIGFAIADRRLFLREGARTITVTFPLRAALNDLPAPGLTVRLTGAEGWHIATDVTLDPGEDEVDEAPGKKGFGRDRPKKRGTRAEAIRSLMRRGGKTEAAGKRDGGKEGGGKEGGRGADDPSDEEAARIKGSYRRTTRPGPVLRLTVRLAPDAPAILPLDPGLHGPEHDPGLPVLEVLFGFASAEDRRAFHRISGLAIRRPRIGVVASGLTQLRVLAAGAEADPAKPFAPFGPRPRVGDTLMLGSSEIFAKPLESWGITLTWAAPYGRGAYFLKRASSDYTLTPSVLAGGVWTSAEDKEAPVALFGNRGKLVLPGAGLVPGKGPMLADNPPFNDRTREGFVRLRLDQGFGHDDYPQELTRASVALARGEGYSRKDAYNYSGGDSPLPDAPYDPELTRIEARYATATGEVEAFRHLWPFGVDAAQTDGLVPVIDWEAALFVGLSGFAGPARITLLAEVANGTGDPLLPRPVLEFARLGEDGFVVLDQRDVDDKSLNLTTPGVIGLALPGPDGTDPSPQMPQAEGGLTWLRIAAPHHAGAVNHLRDVIAQAGRATFVDQGNDPQRLVTPLAPGSIARPLRPDPRVKAVAQPFAGFGGRAAETVAAMDIRCSERLRHKDRGITPWDIEALVLQAFPQIYRAKCLPLTELIRAADGQVTADHENRPGAVSVVAVPYVLPGSPGNPLRPYLDQATLQAVDAHLRPRLSPFVRLEVTNPRIEEVHLDFRVRFAPGIADIAFYRDELDAALVAFLTPWATGQGGEVSFGGRLWKSSVIDFLDSRPFVDFVTDVRMFHKPDASLPDGSWARIDTDLIETRSARSVLVSAARHTIAEVPS